MFKCPDCCEQLSRASDGDRIYWLCPHEHGRAITFSALKHELDPSFLKDLWQRVRSGSFPKDRPCPACRKPMFCVSTQSSSSIVLDVCQVCTFVWLDYGELEQLPPNTKAKKPLSSEGRLAICKLQSTIIADSKLNTPDSPWKYVPALFGLPVRFHESTFERKPALITFTCAILAFIFSALAFFYPHIIESTALAPIKHRLWNLWLGRTLFQFTFVPVVPGNWWFLMSNLYFFIMFGNEVEEFLGRWKYTGLLLLSLSLGSFLHLMTYGGGAEFLVATGGAVAGVLTFYGLLLPHARLGFLLRVVFVPFPAWLGLVMWALLQIFGASYFSFEAEEAKMIYTCNLGGALGGFLYWILHHKSSLRT